MMVMGEECHRISAVSSMAAVRMEGARSRERRRTAREIEWLFPARIHRPFIRSLKSSTVQWVSLCPPNVIRRIANATNPADGLIRCAGFPIRLAGGA